MLCSSGCKFCYDRHLNKIFPNIVMGRDKKKCSHFFCEDGIIHYWKLFDSFDLDEPYSNIANGNIYTTGLNCPTDDLESLSSGKFNLWLSAITLEDKLRSELFAIYKNSEQLLDIIKIAKNLKVYLFCLNSKQILSDIEKIRSVNKDCMIIVASMEYNKCSEDFLVQHSIQGRKDLPDVVKYLHRRYDNIFLSAPSDAIAWYHRDKIKSSLDIYNIQKNDLILCSKAAYSTIKELYENVKYVTNNFEGSIDFSIALTQQNLIDNFEDANRIFVPSSVWWINGMYDIEGKSVEEFKKEHPNVTVVPADLNSTSFKLSIEDSFNYFHNTDVSLGVRK